METAALNLIIGFLSGNLDIEKRKGIPITDELIRKKIEQLGNAGYELSEKDRELVRFKIETIFNVSLLESAILLSDNKVQRWFDSKKGEIEWTYWNAYKILLQQQHRPPEIIRENENVINSILDFSGDPSTPGKWARKGLVMGNVQSGKTQNYLGLINKAFDAGYRVVIVLGGHLNDLRKQTQERIDEGVIGRESKHLIQINSPGKIGVGNFRTVDVQSFTTTEGDFTKSFANKLWSITYCTKLSSNFYS